MFLCVSNDNYLITHIAIILININYLYWKPQNMERERPQTSNNRNRLDQCCSLSTIRLILILSNLRWSDSAKCSQIYPCKTYTAAAVPSNFLLDHWVVGGCNHDVRPPEPQTLKEPLHKFYTTLRCNKDVILVHQCLHDCNVTDKLNTHFG